MSVDKIAISIDHNLLKKLDALVSNNVFKTRSQAIQTAVNDKINRLERQRLTMECEKLNPAYEQSLAEEGLEGDREQWQEF